jgi:hypothetical protein
MSAVEQAESYQIPNSTKVSAHYPDRLSLLKKQQPLT